jgi:hypothetical protein
LNIPEHNQVVNILNAGHSEEPREYHFLATKYGSETEGIRGRRGEVKLGSEVGTRVEGESSARSRLGGLLDEYPNLIYP